ncbi:MAG: apolipoprotein N-acyltransferase [Thermoanaerobaculia bacterium]
MTRASRWALAFAAGALWAFCFGREPLAVAPWFALVPLLLLWSSGGNASIGWFHGLGFWMAGISWIPATLRTFGSLPGWMAAAALVLLAGYLGTYHAAFSWLGARLWRRGGVLDLAAVPALWVALEVVRTHVFTGFPWNLAGYSAAALPGALDATAWVGSYGLSAIVVATNLAVARSIQRRAWAPAVWTCLSVLLFFGVSGRLAEAPSESGSPRAVTILQPNIANLTEWDPQAAEANYRRVFELSTDACHPGELLVWPESAAWPYAYRPGSRLQRDIAALVRSGCTLLFNSPFELDGSYYNAALLKSPGGSAGELDGRYDKQHLVPFGEYVPLGHWLPFLERIARAAGDFAPGPSPGNLSWRGESLGAAICFEVTFPGEVAAKVGAGATVLVTVTNDAWYGDTWAPWQHLRAAQFRAAENRRPLLRSAITGVSAVIGPRGQLLQTLGVDQEGTISASVVGGSAETFYTRAPWAVSVLAFALVAFVIFRESRR